MENKDISSAAEKAAARLAREANALELNSKASFVYNPLDYAWEPHANYIRRYCNSRKRVLFIGMNPGPWGMAQTGVPFGEISFVRDWLGIRGAVSKPSQEHPKKPVDGFACSRSEVSGKRLWSLMQDRFTTAAHFFQEHFVTNYCPLIFLEEGGKNLTPDKLPAADRERLFEVCDSHLRELIRELQPEFVIGIGKFAAQRARSVVDNLPATLPARPTVDWVLHPSPASPMANRGWAEQAVKKLREIGIWDKG